jgi:hypothetical protein
MRYAAGTQLQFQLLDRPGVFAGEIVKTFTAAGQDYYAIATPQTATIDGRSFPITGAIICTEDELLDVGDPRANTLAPTTEKQIIDGLGLTTPEIVERDGKVQLIADVTGLPAAAVQVAKGMLEAFAPQALAPLRVEKTITGPDASYPFQLYVDPTMADLDIFVGLERVVGHCPEIGINGLTMGFFLREGEEYAAYALVPETAASPRAAVDAIFDRVMADAEAAANPLDANDFGQAKLQIEQRLTDIDDILGGDDPECTTACIVEKARALLESAQELYAAAKDAWGGLPSPHAPVAP